MYLSSFAANDLHITKKAENCKLHASFSVFYWLSNANIYQVLLPTKAEMLSGEMSM